MTARVHLLVQHADDLDHTVLGDAIVQNMNRPPDLRSVSRTGRMSEVEAADSGSEFRSLLRQRAFWIVRDLSHRGGENRGVPLLALGTPTLAACRKDVGKIDLRWAGEPKPRHARLTDALPSGRGQSFEIPFEISILDLREVAAFERICAGLDLGAKRFESEVVFLPTLLKDAQGIADSLACVLVFAGFDDLLHKGILLGGQADVPGRHLATG